MLQTKEEDGRTYYQMADGSWLDERWCCGRCLDQGRVGDAEKRYSFGCYAGKYCDDCWRNSGYRDACDPDAEFSELDAGERIEADY